MCCQNVIEDEIHILLQCPLYDDVHSNLLQNVTQGELGFVVGVT